MYLHDMDIHLETMKKHFDRGQAHSRKRNPEYTKAYNRGDGSHRKCPKFIVSDPNFKSLKWVRYADDYLIAVIGSYQDGIKIRDEIGAFLKEKLGLDINTEKSLITHATNGAAKYLGHDIKITSPKRKPTKAFKQISGK